MSIRWMMGLMAFYILCQIVCCIGEGIYTGNGVVDEINAMTGYRNMESQGILALPMMGMTFFSNLPKILAFDYSFLEGGVGFQLIRAMGMVMSVGVVFGLLQVFLPAFQGLASRFLKLFGG